MIKELARNKKANFDYEILETFEAGIVLQGSEVKSLRMSKVNIKDSFIRIIKGELWLLNAHIALLSTTNSFFRPDERAARKLLMHKKQIDKLFGKVTIEGLTLVPLSLYLNDKNIVKARIALAKGKKLHDKRQSLKIKDLNRQAQSAMKKYI